MKLARATLYFSYLYHLQTDGQTERLGQCLEMYLRCMAHQKSEGLGKVACSSKVVEKYYLLL